MNVVSSFSSRDASRIRWSSTSPMRCICILRTRRALWIWIDVPGSVLLSQRSFWSLAMSCIPELGQSNLQSRLRRRHSRWHRPQRLPQHRRLRQNLSGAWLSAMATAMVALAKAFEDLRNVARDEERTPVEMKGVDQQACGAGVGSWHRSTTNRSCGAPCMLSTTTEVMTTIPLPASRTNGTVKATRLSVRPPNRRHPAQNPRWPDFRRRLNKAFGAQVCARRRPTPSP